MALLTHKEADKEVQSAMGQPASSAMDSFQKFLSNRGTQQGAQPKVPQLPKESIKKLPISTISPA